MRSFIWCYRTANFKFEFLRRGSRWVKFEAEIRKFDFKFECKISIQFYRIFILIFLLRGKGLELRSASQLSKRARPSSSKQSAAKHKAKRS